MEYRCVYILPGCVQYERYRMNGTLLSIYESIKGKMCPITQTITALACVDINQCRWFS